jgi:hypothetical protein
MTLTCTKCGDTKEECEFYNCKARKTGKTGQCKQCMDESAGRWAAANKREASELRRACKYGIKKKDLHVLMQVPVCQACGVALPDDHAAKIDHCHEQGHIRGILCNMCNLACAGFTRDAIIRLQKCRSYLLREVERASEQEGTGSTTNLAG